MPLVVKDRVRETSTTTGTGTITLNGAVSNFQSFSVIGNGNTTFYTITLDSAGEWEVGIGTYTASGTTLSRDTVLESSNGGSLVPFSAGTKTVFVTYPAEKSVADGKTNIIEVSSTDAALRITQLGTGNALVVEDESPDSTPFVVNTDGRVITGATQAYTNYLDGFVGTARNPTVQFNGTSGSTASSVITNWANANSPPIFVLAKSKSGTVGTMTSTFSVGDIAGAIQFSASDNTNFIPTALIEAQIDGTPGTGDMPGSLVFSTTADGGSIPTERMRISSDGRLQINGANALTSSLVATANTFPLNLAATAYQFRAEATFGTANTSAIGFGSTYQLPATGAFSSSYQFYAGGLTTGGATITNNFGVYITGQTVGTNIYGIFSNIASGTNRYNFYANGTADNYFAGNVGIGTTAPLTALNVNGTGGELIRISVTADGVTQQEPALGFATGVTNTHPAAKISALEFDASDSRASLLFYTRDTNSDVAPTERLRIDYSGAINMANTSSLQKGGVDAFALKNVTYLTSGTAATYTTPTGVRALKVTVVGGGGGGGGVNGSTTASTNAYSDGGGGGGYAIAFIASAEASYTYTVGAGGTGGAIGANNGASGGTTEFKNAGSTVIVSATGGGGGLGDTGATSTGATTGAPGVGSITGLGTPGGVIGSGTGVYANGYGRYINGQLYSLAGSGYCPLIGGGVISSVGATGANATNYGEGGGNVRTNTAIGTDYAGGNGFAGLIIVEEYY